MPAVVSRGRGEAARDQEMAHLVLAEEPSWVIRSLHVEGYPSIFFFRYFGRQAPDALAKFRPGYPPGS